MRNVNNFAHKAARHKKLSKYDYGLLGNLKKYDTRVPPNYNLMQVIKKVDLIAAENDKLSALEEMEILVGQMSNVRERKQWNKLIILGEVTLKII